MNVNYVTRVYRRLPEHLEQGLHGKLFAIIGACAPDWRFGALLGQEGDCWIVNLGGYLDEQVPLTDFSDSSNLHAACQNQKYST